MRRRFVVRIEGGATGHFAQVRWGYSYMMMANWPSEEKNSAPCLRLALGANFILRDAIREIPDQPH